MALLEMSSVMSEVARILRGCHVQVCRQAGMVSSVMCLVRLSVSATWIMLAELSGRAP